jgi:hypothetical protein
MKRQHSYIQDSAHLLYKLETTVFPQDITLLTADVESLYPSINLEDALGRIRHLLLQDNDWGDKRDTHLILDVMHWVLYNNVFQFGDTTWLQIRGTAMGSPLAVVFANLYLSCLETELLNGLPNQPLLYCRFIDDIFVILNGETPECVPFMLAMNNMHDTINLTSEFGDSVPFLDLVVFKGPRFFSKGLLDVKLHQKQMNSDLYICPTSFHPSHCFKSFISGELTRFLRNTCTSSTFCDLKKLFYLRLRQRGYRSGFLKPLFAAICFSARTVLIDNLIAKFTNLSNTDDHQSRVPLVLKTIYEPRSRLFLFGQALNIPEYLEHDQFFNDVFEKGKPLVCWKSGRNLLSLLCPTKFNQPVAETWDPGPPTM